MQTMHRSKRNPLKTNYSFFFYLVQVESSKNLKYLKTLELAFKFHNSIFHDD